MLDCTCMDMLVIIGHIEIDLFESTESKLVKHDVQQKQRFYVLKMEVYWIRKQAAC